MKGKRVYQLAGELGIDTRELVKLGRSIGMGITHFAFLEPEEIEKLMHALEEQGSEKITVPQVEPPFSYVDLNSIGDVPIIDRATGKPLDPENNVYGVVFLWASTDPMKIAKYKANYFAEFVTKDDPFYPMEIPLDAEGHYKAPYKPHVLMKIPKKRWEFIREQKRKMWEQQRLRALREYEENIEREGRALGLPVGVKIEDFISKK